MNKYKREQKCSFCGKEPHEVEQLLAGPEAFICNTTSPGPGVGSGKLRISIFLLPRNTAPRMPLPPVVKDAMIPGRRRVVPLPCLS